ncbi:MAG: DnaD domain protein [Bacilli bacterium]|jgi:DNA replication protein|nr:DnaD domain protein [Bacilli bacterium]
MFNKVMDLIKTKDLNVPGLLFYNYSKLNLDYEQLYFLIYLLNLDNLEFDISKFSKELNKKPKEIIKIINDLDEKEIISLDITKNNDDVKEMINLNLFYKKLTYLIIEEEEEKVEKIDIVKEFEKVFKRELIGREKHIITAWKQAGYEDSFLMAGLKEAEYNGEYSLTYIDTVLDNWDKQGFKTEEDINKEKQSNPKEDEIPFIEVDESDWIYQ